MGKEDFKESFEAIVEIDETYVGGKPRKSNKKDKDGKDNNDPNKPKSGRGTAKTPIIGVKERNTGKVYAKVAKPNKDGKKLTGKQLLSILNKVCKPNTIVVTDEFAGYNILDKENEKNLFRIKIDHSVGYSDCNGTHTNGIESFWAVLKRGLYGIYHQVSTKHLQDYVNEFCFRLNHRKDENAFDCLMSLSVAR